jgi:hypothetical protein
VAAVALAPVAPAVAAALQRLSLSSSLDKGKVSRKDAKTQTARRQFGDRPLIIRVE